MARQVGSRAVLGIAIGMALAGCVGGAEGKGAPGDDPLADGKADVATRLTMGPLLALGGEVTGAFTADLQFFGHGFAVRPDSSVTLDVRRTGSGRGLDSTLYVYGPRGADGSFGDEWIAFDDDSGYAALSRLVGVHLVAGGEYLAVIGTYGNDGRGAYRLSLECDDDDCSPIAPPVSDVEATIARVTAELGLSDMPTTIDDDEVARQIALGGTVGFEGALRAALDSFLNDGDDPESPLGLVSEETIEDGPCTGSDPHALVRCFMSLPSSDFSLVAIDGYPPEGGESVTDAWIFSLYMDDLSDHGHWAIVDRTGAEGTYNYGFN